MAKLLAVEARADYRLWLRYEDGVTGEVDLSYLAGRGVFSSAWQQKGAFDAVELGPNGEVAWGDIADLCPDALYLRVTGKAIDELMPGLSSASLSA